MLEFIVNYKAGVFFLFALVCGVCVCVCAIYAMTQTLKLLNMMQKITFIEINMQNNNTGMWI